MLLACDPHNANHDDFADAIRLYCDMSSVDEYSLHKLQNLNTPIARISASILTLQLRQHMQTMQEACTLS